MINKIQPKLGDNLLSKYKNTVAGVVFSVLSLMGFQDALSQTTPFQDNLKKPNIELAKKDPVIQYIYKTLPSYYPNEKGYIDGLFDKYESQTRLDTALVFLHQMYKELEQQGFDDKKKLQVVVCCLESTLLGGEFYDRHEKEIDDQTFEYIMKFDKVYVEFLKRYFARVQGRMKELLAKIKQLDEKSKQLDEKSKQLDEKSKQLDDKIDKNLRDIETIIAGFTPAHVQKNPHLQKLVIDTYNVTLEAKRTPSQHLLDLYFAATKK